MSSLHIQHGFGEAEYHKRTRVPAVVTVAAGSVLIAAAAFVLSYGPIQKIALAAGVPPRLSALYPLMLETMLVVACVAALALRRAGWWIQAYAWLTTLMLISAMAAADGTRAANLSLPRRPTAAAIAIAPWGLLLLGLVLYLSMLSQRTRAQESVKADRAPRDSEGRGEPAGEVEHRQRPAAAATDWNEGSLRLPGSRFEPLISEPDPDGPAVRLLPSQPKLPASDPDPDGPAVRLLPSQPKLPASDPDPDGPAVRLLPHDPEA
jgi:Protein of unknown function (DUF2637)